jgi:hypothetical protein
MRMRSKAIKPYIFQSISWRRPVNTIARGKYIYIYIYAYMFITCSESLNTQKRIIFDGFCPKLVIVLFFFLFYQHLISARTRYICTIFTVFFLFWEKAPIYIEGRTCIFYVLQKKYLKYAKTIVSAALIYWSQKKKNPISPKEFIGVSIIL